MTSNQLNSSSAARKAKILNSQKPSTTCLPHKLKAPPTYGLFNPLWPWKANSFSLKVSRTLGIKPLASAEKGIFKDFSPQNAIFPYQSSINTDFLNPILIWIVVVEVYALSFFKHLFAFRVQRTNMKVM